MTRTPRPLAGLLLLGLLAGCGNKENDGPVTASVMGSMPAIADPNRKPLPLPSAALLAATAQGLVRFDGAGQIEPGLAMRWDVSDDGLYYTFRLATGLSLDADDVARRLRSAIARASRNPLKPLFGSVDEIVAVTPEVVEIRLFSPQPHLLELLAHPEMALLDDGAGSGPFQIAIRESKVLTLSPVAPPDGEEVTREGNSDTVKLRGERVALAVARFVEGEADLILGGTFADLALARVARPPVRTLHFDPAGGLLGLAVVRPKGFLASADNRRALALAIDRARIAAAFPESGWRSAESLVPPGTELGSAVAPDWASLAPALRRQIASSTIRFWTQRNGALPILRVAMPEGPGARLLFTLLAVGWREAGITVESVALGADADLRLIDAVAPSDSAAWYLRLFSCSESRVCSDTADKALLAADRAITVEERTARLAEANAALAGAVPYLPIAQPLRWSLVSPRLEGFQENARAVHPLNHLLRRER